MRTLIISIITAAFLLATGTTGAAIRILAMQINGAGACQAALPTYEGLIRKRPMAIQNEGSSTAFVTCSPLNMQGMYTSEIHGHGVHLVNSNEVSVLLACSAVVGARDGIADHTVTKAVQIPAGATRAIYWGGDEIPSSNGDTFNTTCALPSGTAITTVMVHQVLDIGE